MSHARRTVSVRARTAWLVRLAVSTVLIGWVLSNDEVRHGLRDVPFVYPWYVVAAVLSGGVAAVCGAWRWHVCLRACGVGLPFATVLRLSLAGSAAGLLSVGALGVDVVRLALATKRLPQRKAPLLASIALDHMSAIPAMIAIGALVISILGAKATLDRALLRFMLLPLAIFVLVAIGVQMIRPSWHARLLAFVTQGVQWRRVLPAVAIALPVLVFHYGVFWCTMQALGITAHKVGVFGAVVVADTMTALPFTVAGIGVREKAFEVLLFTWYGVLPAQSVKASLVGFAVLALWAVCGALCLPLRDGLGEAAA